MPTNHAPARALAALPETLLGATCALLALALALLPLPLAAGLVLGGGLLLLALVNPVWALYAAVLAVPVQVVVTLPGGLSLVQAAFLLATGTWGLYLLAHPNRPMRLGRVFLGLAALLWALACSAAFTPYSQADALRETLRWLTVALIYLLAYNTLAPQQPGFGWRVGGLLACLLLAPLANALFGLWQFFTGTGPPSFEVAGGYVRAYGTIGAPNSFAGYMNMALPLALALTGGVLWALALWALETWRARRPWLEIEPPVGLLALLVLVGVPAALIGGALVASYSRGGWLGALGGLGGMALGVLLLLNRRLLRALGSWLGLAVAAALLLPLVLNLGLVPDSLLARAESIVRNLRLFDVRTVEVFPENFAVVERMAQMQAAWTMLVEHPLTGVGAGNYSAAYAGLFQQPPYLLHPWYTPQGHAHNYYLHIAAEAGWLGLSAYLLLLGLLIRQAYATVRSVHGWFWQSVAVGGCGIIASVAVHNVFENLHVLNMGVQLGAVWGLLAALERHTTQPRQNQARASEPYDE